VQFVRAVCAAGCDAAIVHARKAVLGGLSPKDNREVPPLRFDVVHRLRAEMPDVPLIVNGGLRTAEAAAAALTWCDGVMLGREAYHRPHVLAELQALAYPGDSWRTPSRVELAERMARYAEREVSTGTRISAIARHVLGLYAHEPGAREFRRRVSEGSRAVDATPSLIAAAARAAHAYNP